MKIINKDVFLVTILLTYTGSQYTWLKYLWHAAVNILKDDCKNICAVINRYSLLCIMLMHANVLMELKNVY